MPKINKSAQESSSFDSPIDNVMNSVSADLAITTSPVFICGVNRKINIGNFENIDVYAAVTIPLPNVSFEDKEGLRLAIEDAAAYGFAVVSKETGDRYSLIKESQQGNK
jgi:hypothetical protein